MALLQHLDILESHWKNFIANEKGGRHGKRLTSPPQNGLASVGDVV